MRSTLLFVAVLLACAPAHADATTPPESPSLILGVWLNALLPVPASETVRENAVKPHPVATRRIIADGDSTQAPRRPEASRTGQSVAPRTHDSNAP
jgi:hypothetical protein